MALATPTGIGQLASPESLPVLAIEGQKTLRGLSPVTVISSSSPCLEYQTLLDTHNLQLTKSCFFLPSIGVLDLYNSTLSDWFTSRFHPQLSLAIYTNNIIAPCGHSLLCPCTCTPTPAPRRPTKAQRSAHIDIRRVREHNYISLSFSLSFFAPTFKSLHAA